MVEVCDPFGFDARVWVGGLPMAITEEKVFRVFQEFGAIKWIRVRKGHYDTFCFVQYVQKDDAARAIAKMDQSKVFGGESRNGVIKVSHAMVEASLANGKGKGKKSRSRSRSWQQRYRSKSRSLSRARKSRSKSPPPWKRPSLADKALILARRSRSESSPPWKRQRSPSAACSRSRSRSHSRPALPRMRHPQLPRARSRSPSPRKQEGGGAAGVFRITPTVRLVNLPEDMDKTELCALGEVYGPVAYVNTWMYATKRHGKLLYESMADAVEAIYQLDGRKIDGWDEQLTAFIPCQSFPQY